MSVKSAINYPIRIVLDLAFAVANRWLTKELDSPFLWPNRDVGIMPHDEPWSVGPARPVRQSVPCANGTGFR